MTARRTAGPVAGAMLLTLVLVVRPVAPAEPLSPARRQQILHEALNAYDQAVTLSREDAGRAIELYREAAAGFRALRDAGVASAALDYNLGNTYFRLGNLGQAILHYRRAETLAPGDGRIAANLRYARGRVEPHISPSGGARLAQHLLAWHYQSSVEQRYAALAGCAAVGAGLLLAWLRWRRALLLAGLALLLFGWAAAGSLLWQLRDEARHPHAVLVQDQQPLRLARGESADLALPQPLGAGVEVRIVQQRGEWVEVRLANDQTGWLPAAAVARV